MLVAPATHPLGFPEPVGLFVHGDVVDERCDTVRIRCRLDVPGTRSTPDSRSPDRVSRPRPVSPRDVSNPGPGLNFVLVPDLHVTIRDRPPVSSRGDTQRGPAPDGHAPRISSRGDTGWGLGRGLPLTGRPRIAGQRTVSDGRQACCGERLQPAELIVGGHVGADGHVQDAVVLVHRENRRRGRRLLPVGGGTEAVDRLTVVG